MATEITVIRHGETVWNTEKRIQGQLNSELTENGILQAELVAGALKKRSFDVLITSDLGRTAHTARIINNELQLPFQLNSNLRERNFGILQGKKYLEIERHLGADYHFFKQREPDYEVPEGESIGQLYRRVTSEIENLSNKYKDQNVLIVAHGLVLEMIMYKTFSVPLNNSRVFSINNSSISSFYIDNDNWFLKEWGVIEHLVSLNVLNEL